MNTNILQKCLKILREDPQPIDIAYVTGMLETLIEMQDTPKAQYGIGAVHTETFGTGMGVVNTTDEAAIMDAKAKAALASVKALSEASSHE
jgi:hypothetical protein